METVILSGSGNVPLTTIAKILALPLGKPSLSRSPDGELRVEVPSATGVACHGLFVGSVWRAESVVNLHPRIDWSAVAGASVLVRIPIIDG